MPPPPPPSPAAPATITAAGPSLVQSLFQSSLDDMIKSLRSDPGTAAVSRAAADASREIRSPDAATKSLALQKLTYLSSLHFIPVLPLAAFPAVELLASSSPATKRLAYLAADLLFHRSTTDLLTLATHQLRKDLVSPVPHARALALHLLASADSPDLAEHLANDLASVISPRAGGPAAAVAAHKSVAAAARVVSYAPSATVPVLFQPLVETLSSPDPQAVSAAVSAFCELTAPPADPKTFLPLAPVLFDLLTGGSDRRARLSNWAVIKLLKIFTRLANSEPRLVARLADPVVQLMRESSALSLVFECIRTVLTALLAHPAAVSAAVDRAKGFLSAAEDPNLRYLGLQAFAMLPPSYSLLLLDCRDAVAGSLIDPDPSIRRHALGLMMAMVNNTNITDIAELLINHANQADPEFATDILNSVLTTCVQNDYELISDFDWYVTLLGLMSHVPHCACGDEIERQLVDIGLRVMDARPELVRVAQVLLADPVLLSEWNLFRVLAAAAWLSGEYVHFSKNPLELIEALVQPRTGLLPMSVRAVYIQAVLKVLTFCCSTHIKRLRQDYPGNIGMSSAEKDPFSRDSVIYMLDLVEATVGPLAESDEVEVQERAHNVLGLVDLLKDMRDLKDDVEGDSIYMRIEELLALLHSVFSGGLGPVSVSAQKKVQVPGDLVLVEDLAGLGEYIGDDSTRPLDVITFYEQKHSTKVGVKEEPANYVDSSSQLAEHRRRNKLYYLNSDKSENLFNDYLPASEPLLAETQDSTKPRVIKPRPKVVKLEESVNPEAPSLARSVGLADDPLSGAFHSILLVGDGNPSTSKQPHTNAGTFLSQSDENARSGLRDDANLSSTRETREKGERKRRGSKSIRHDQGRRRHQRNSDALDAPPLSQAPQAPTVVQFPFVADELLPGCSNPNE